MHDAGEVKVDTNTPQRDASLTPSKERRMKSVKLTRVDRNNATNRSVFAFIPGPGLFYTPAESGGTRLGGPGFPTDEPVIVLENVAQVELAILSATRH
jgi:hypothetical protein